MQNDCPRCNNEPAIHDPVFGILPGSICQGSDDRFAIGDRHDPEFTSLARMTRIQNQRDKHHKDLLQPFIRNEPNPDFVMAYPGKARDYFHENELKKL